MLEGGRIYWRGGGYIEGREDILEGGRIYWKKGGYIEGREDIFEEGREDIFKGGREGLLRLRILQQRLQRFNLAPTLLLSYNYVQTFFSVAKLTFLL